MMFGWFKPRCPLNTWEKAWTETTFAELMEVVGLPRVIDAQLLLPTRDYFPEAFGPPPHDAQAMLARVRQYVRLDVGEVGVRVLREEDETWDATRDEARWDEPVARVHEEALVDAEVLVAALACELARIHLAQTEAYAEPGSDGPWAAELLAVMLGAGVFVANATVGEQHANSQALWHTWQMRRRGAMPARMVGYGLALFAWTRDEPATWSSCLRPDAAQALTDGLRYLRRTEDSLFVPMSYAAGAPEPSVAALIDQLTGGTPSGRMAALWAIARRPVAAAATEEHVIACVSSRDVQLRVEAQRTLSAIGARSPAAEEAVLHGLRDASEDARAAATYAAAELFPDSDRMIEELAMLLEDDSGEVVCGAAYALSQHGRRAADQLNRVLAVLKRGIVACHEPITAAACRALTAIAADPAYCLCERFADDPEMLDQAIRHFRNYGSPGEAAID